MDIVSTVLSKLWFAGSIFTSHIIHNINYFFQKKKYILFLDKIDSDTVSSFRNVCS